MEYSLVVGAFPASPVECGQCFAQRVYAGESVNISGISTSNSRVEAGDGAESFLQEIARRLGHAAVGFIVFVMLHCCA